MQKEFLPPQLDLMRNAIDMDLIPYSDRGSRVMIFRDADNRFLIRLAERLARIDPGIEAYLKRPPFIDQLAIIDKNEAQLPYVLTWNPYGVRLETIAGDFYLLIDSSDRLVIGIPDGVQAGVRLRCNTGYYRETFQNGSQIPVRELSWRVKGSIFSQKSWQEDDSQWMEVLLLKGTDSAIALTIGEEHDNEDIPILSAATLLEDNQRRWQDWFARVPAVDSRFARPYTYACWNMANNLISPKGNVLFEAMMPSKVKYVGLWLWDCAMHAVAFRHIDPELARKQIRAMLVWQLEDGMLPDAIFDDGIVSEIDFPIHAKVTKPPILAWAAWKIHEVAPDLEFIREIYPQLVRENHWWFNENDDDRDGIVQYSHPYSSGLDDNPLWDYGMPVESPDLNTYLCLQMNALAKMAEELGLDDEAKDWQQRSIILVDRMIEHLWDEKAGVFQFLHDHKTVPVLTPFNLFPLWTGILPDRICKRLVEHLRDPKEFWGNYCLPTVAYNDRHFDEDTMWRGPVWTNINYFMIEALQKNGELDLARELRKKTLQMILEQGGMYEYYNARTGEPPVKAARVFGWTAAVFIDLAIQESQDPEHD